jgi:hypothetical protein
MLDVIQDENIATFDWSKVEKTTRLPANLTDFFERQGMTPVQHATRRVHHRFFLRSRAIVRWQSMVLGAYSVDASRSGIAFLSPVEIAVKERVGIRLPKTKEFQLEIVRCRRLEDECFECGAMFVLGK